MIVFGTLSNPLFKRTELPESGREEAACKVKPGRDDGPVTESELSDLLGTCEESWESLLAARQTCED